MGAMRHAAKAKAVHKPRVGLNAHLLSLASSYRGAGLSRYIAGLVAYLPQADASSDYVALVGDKRVSTPGWERHVSPWRTAGVASRILWEQSLQAWTIRQAKLDLLHAPVYVGPLLSSCPVVATIHDLSFYLYPDLFRRGQRAYLQHLTRETAKRAAAVIAVSENTRADVIRILGLAPSSVHVIPNGLDESMKVLPEDQVAAWRRSKGLPDRFVLFVGTLEPRKNIPFLLQAYAALPRSEASLVIAGGKGWYYDEIYRTVEQLGLGDRVIFPGFVPQEELAWWYNAAIVFCYPSLYEGFGWPPLEAMACGTPVIVTRSSSLPEVVGDSGVIIEPGDVRGLSDAMSGLLTEPAQRRAWGVKGLARASAFSWWTTARQTAALYHQVLGVEGDESSHSA